MGSISAIIQACATAQPRPMRALRLLDIEEHKAWREFQHWWESRAAGGVPSRTRYTDAPRQAQLRPAIDDRIIWSIDMERSFQQLAPIHRAMLELLVSGESIAIQAHRHGTSVRTLMRRRDAALRQLAGIRRRYAEDDED
jgi:hypothetical protein